MQREALSLGIEHTGWITSDRAPEKPCLVVEYDGEESTFIERFRQPGAGLYTASGLDLFYRFQPSVRALPRGGVFTVADRVTGDLLLEVTTPPKRIERFVSAVRQYAERTGDNPTYRVKLWTETQVADFEKEVFLVYNAEGGFISQRSLVPDWIEM